MTNEQRQVAKWMSAFGQETPSAPTIPSLEVRKLRAKLILEEALETIQGLGISAYVQDQDNEWDSIHDLHWEFQEVDRWEPSLDAIADGCEDLKVVTEGTLVACGLCQPKPPENVVGEIYRRADNDPLFDEVMRSNWSKMWTEDSLDIYLSDDDCKKHQVIKHGDK